MTLILKITAKKLYNRECVGWVCGTSERWVAVNDLWSPELTNTAMHASWHEIFCDFSAVKYWYDMKARNLAPRQNIVNIFNCIICD